MSKHTNTTTPSTQDQTPDTVVQVPEPTVPTEGTAQQPPVEPTPEQVAEQQAQTEVAAAAAEQEAREEANATLKAVVTSYRRGEREYRKGLLEAGGHSARYVQQRLALGDKRDAAVDLLTLELSRYASATVVVNDMVGAYWAYQLLAVDQGLDQAPDGKKAVPADAVPYGVYRDEWSRLVQRTTTKATETWALLPGVEEEARTLFRTVLERSLSRSAVKDHVNGVVHKARLAAEEAVRTEKARLQAAQEQAAQKAAAERKRAAELQQQADQLKAAGDKQAAAAVEEQVVQTVRSATQATRDAEQLEAKVEQQEAKEAKAQEATAKAARKLEPKAEPSKPAPKLTAPTAGKAPAGDQPALPTKPAPVLSVEADARQLGVECAAVLAECDAPEDALEALLEELLEYGALSKHGDRAVQAALTLLRRSAKATSPAETTPVTA